MRRNQGKFRENQGKFREKQGRFREIADALHGLARPYLTVLIATGFNAICAWAWWRSELSIVEYITAIGPTNGLIIGFWFGERAALKMPYNPCGPYGHGGRDYMGYGDNIYGGYNPYSSFPDRHDMHDYSSRGNRRFHRHGEDMDISEMPMEGEQ